jgi:two-component system nitrogen regulation response regulator GlnG
MTPRVLILEDEASIRRLCVRALAPLGWRIAQAERLADVLRMDDLASYDLLITDIMLEDGNGLDAASQFLRLKPSAPVIVITGSPTAGVRDRAERMGVSCFLTKPFDLDVFVRAARAAMKEHEGAE